MTDWKSVQLGDIARPVTARAGEGSLDVPVYSVTKHRGFVKSLEYFKKQVFSRDVGKYRLVEPGQFAYATIHLDEGSIGIAPERSLVSPMYTVFEIDAARVDGSFLIRYLKAPVALAAYPTLGRGSAERRKTISFDSLCRLTVPLPPLDEQRGIADILDRADALRAKRRETLDRLDELKSSVVHGLLEGIERDQGRELGDLLSKPLRNGRSPSTSGTEAANVLTLGAITGDTFDLDAARLADFDHIPQNARAVPGELLICRGNGNPELVGRGQIVPAEAADLVFPDTMIAAAIDPTHLHPVLIDVIWNSTLVRRQVSRYAKTTNGTLKVNQTALRGTRIPVPAADAQARAVKRLRALGAAHVHATASARALDTLFASLEQRAFRGDLFSSDLPHELADAA